jgi:hypothetical protein
VRPIYRKGIPLPSRCCILYIFFSTNVSTEYFKHAAHSPFFSSKCRLFHNANFFGLYYSHFTYRVCWNLNAKLRCQKVKHRDSRVCYVTGWLKIYFRLFLFTDSTKHISCYSKVSYVICVNHLNSFNLQKLVCSSLETDSFGEFSVTKKVKKLSH